MQLQDLPLNPTFTPSPVRVKIKKKELLRSWRRERVNLKENNLKKLDMSVSRLFNYLFSIVFKPKYSFPFLAPDLNF